MPRTREAGGTSDVIEFDDLCCKLQISWRSWENSGWVRLLQGPADYGEMQVRHDNDHPELRQNIMYRKPPATHSKGCQHLPAGPVDTTAEPGPRRTLAANCVTLTAWWPNLQPESQESSHWDSRAPKKVIFLFGVQQV